MLWYLVIHLLFQCLPGERMVGLPGTGHGAGGGDPSYHAAQSLRFRVQGEQVVGETTIGQAVHLELEQTRRRRSEGIEFYCR